MARALRDIQKDIKSLPPEDKNELLRHLVGELDGAVDPDVDRAWLQEAQRRYRELQEGSVELIPAEKVFESLSSRLLR